MLSDYVIPETPDCLLDETPLAAEIRARSTLAASRRAKVVKAEPAPVVDAKAAAAAAERAALAARAAHLAVLHPTHSSVYEKASKRKKVRRQIPVKGRATLTGANPGHRITRHPIQLAHSHMLPRPGTSRSSAMPLAAGPTSSSRSTPMRGSTWRSARATGSTGWIPPTSPASSLPVMMPPACRGQTT